jgi:hypothetical protein
MTYRPDDPRSAPHVERDGNSIIDAVAKVAVAFACTFIVVMVLYAMNHDDNVAVTTSSPAPATTTGQSNSAEPKAESKGEPKGEPKAEQKAEPKADPKADQQGEPKTK